MSYAIGVSVTSNNPVGIVVSEQYRARRPVRINWIRQRSIIVAEIPMRYPIGIHVVTGGLVGSIYLIGECRSGAGDGKCRDRVSYPKKRFLGNAIVFNETSNNLA